MLLQVTQSKYMSPNSPYETRSLKILQKYAKTCNNVQKHVKQGKGDFDQRLKFATPKHWSKNSTLYYVSM